jgi:hypothetical protein
LDESHAFLIREKLQPFKCRVLAAVPGKSLNNRNYSKEVLSQAAPLYKGKPFILDHDIANAEKVIAIFTDSKYGSDKTMQGEEKEGLWLEGIGLMNEDLFAKVQGTSNVPPLIRGVSIGGEGEGELTSNGVDLRKFLPEELSLTAFPGIPSAHIAQIEAIRESYRKINQKEEMNVKEVKTKDATVMDIPLEEAEKIVKVEVKEGPLPTSPDSTTKISIPQVPNVIVPSYTGSPAITQHYDVTNPQTTLTATPPTEVPRVHTIEPNKQQVPLASAEKPKSIETKSFTTPNFMAPMEIGSRETDVVARAYTYANEMRDKQAAWYKIAREILEKALGHAS